MHTMKYFDIETPILLAFMRSISLVCKIAYTAPISLKFNAEMANF